MHFIPSATVTWKGSKRGLFREYLIIFDDFAFIAPEIDSSLDKLVDPVNQSMVAFHNSIPTPVGLRHCLIIFQILHDISRYSIPELAIINTLYIIIFIYVHYTPIFCPAIYIMLLPGLPWVLLLPCFWRDLQEPWGMGGSRWKSGQSITKWPGIMVKGNPSKMAFRLPGKLTVCYWTWPLKLGFIHRKRWFVMVENGLIINPPFPDTQERATGRPNMYLKVEKSRKITKNPPFDTPPTFEHIKYSWTWRFFPSTSDVEPPRSRRMANWSCWRPSELPRRPGRPWWSSPCLGSWSAGHGFDLGPEDCTLW